MSAEKCRAFIGLCGNADVKLLLDTQNPRIFVGLDAPELCSQLRDFLADQYHAKDGKDVFVENPNGGTVLT